MYALANAGQRALSFLLLPLYISVLSPAEYGRLGILLTLQSAAVVVFSVGMENSVTRRYVQLEGVPDTQAAFFLTVWSFSILSTILVAAGASVILLVFVPASSAFDPAQGALAILGAAIFVGATVVPLTVLRAQYALRKYLLLTCTVALTTAFLTVVLVVVCGFGVVGWLLAALGANALTLLVAAFFMPWRRPAFLARDDLRTVLKLGLPLVPHSVSGWSLQLADRAILASLVSIGSLGIYTLAANLALPALVVLQGLNLGFLPTYAKAHADHGALRSLRGAVNLQIALTVALGCTTSLLGPPFVGILPHNFSDAEDLIPWIALGYVFFGLYLIPMNVISMVIGRTGRVWILSMTAAVANIGAIYILTPAYGTLGAAIASAIGYLVLLLAVALYSRLFETRIDFDWFTVCPVLGISTAVFILACILPAQGVAGVSFRCLLLIPLVGLVSFAAGVSVTEAAPKLEKLFSQRASRH